MRVSDPGSSPAKPKPAPAKTAPPARANAQHATHDDKAPPKATTTPQAGHDYHVKKGDTLWDISKKAYGDPTRWPEIRDANPAKVTHDGNIRAGDTLRIPPDTVKDGFKPDTGPNKFSPAATTKQQISEEKAVKKELMDEFRANLDASDHTGRRNPAADAARASVEARATVSKDPGKAAILERAEGRSARTQATAALTNAAAAQREAERATTAAQDAHKGLNEPAFRTAVRNGDVSPQDLHKAQENATKLDATAQKAQDRAQGLMVSARYSAERALKEQREANQAATKVADKLPFPAATKATNLARAETLSPQQQKDIFGAALPKGISQARPTPPKAAATPTAPVEKPVVTDAQKAKAATEAITRDANAIGSAPTDDARRDATLKAVKTLEDQVNTLPESQRAAVMQANQESIEKITGGLNLLNKEQTGTAVASLSRTAETLGQKNVDLLAAPVARALPGMVKGHGDNGGELSSGIRDAIKNGDGALFGAAVTRQLAANGEKELAKRTSDATAGGIKDVREAFDDKQKKADELNMQLAGFVADWGPTRTPQEIEAGIKAFQDKNKDVYSDLDNAAEKMVKTQEGVQYVDQHKADYSAMAPTTVAYGRGGSARTPGEKPLLDATNDFVDRADQYLATTKGQEALGKALDQSARGEPSILDSIKDRTGAVGGAKSVAEKVGTVAVNYVANKVSTMAQAGQWEEAANTLKKLGPFVDPKKLEGMTSALERGATLGAERFSTEFAKEAGNLKMSLGKDTALGKAFGGLGLVVSGASLVNGIANFKDGDIKERMQTLASLAQVGSDISKVFSVGEGAAAFLKALGKGAPGISAALGMVDVATNVANGDLPMAATSLASTAGGILMATSVGGPVGTAVGAVLVVGALGVGYFINRHRAEEREHHGEENLQAFLKGAGFTEQQALRLRDLDGDLRSTGPMFDAAARQMEMSPRDFLYNVLTKVPDGKMTDVINAAEGVPRHDDGTFVENDPKQVVVGGRGAPYRGPNAPPRSVEGWVKWMEHQGFL